MIKVNVNEQFPVTVALVDETAGEMGIGKQVYYDIRQQPNDTLLSPTVNGFLPESTAVPGLYTKLFSIDTAGDYIVYTSCSGFVSGADDIIVTEDSTETLSALIKQTRHFNLSVEDVIRENAVATASQTARNVALGKTDYIRHRIKADDASDWSGVTISGVVFAHYRNVGDDVPYLMGGDGL